MYDIESLGHMFFIEYFKRKIIKGKKLRQNPLSHQGSISFEKLLVHFLTD